MKLRWTLLLVAPLIAGCHVNPPVEGRNDPYRTPQVEFTDEKLRDATAIGEIKLTRDNRGLLFVTVPIRSTSDRSFYIDSRITFFDANGHPMSSTGWHQKMLDGNVEVPITENSLDAGAKDFQMDLRYAK